MPASSLQHPVICIQHGPRAPKKPHSSSSQPWLLLEPGPHPWNWSNWSERRSDTGTLERSLGDSIEILCFRALVGSFLHSFWPLRSLFTSGFLMSKAFKNITCLLGKQTAAYSAESTPEQACDSSWPAGLSQFPTLTLSTPWHCR
jgi:hypothetical protein